MAGVLSKNSNTRPGVSTIETKKPVAHAIAKAPGMNKESLAVLLLESHKIKLIARFEIGHTPRKNRPNRSQPPASTHIIVQSH